MADQLMTFKYVLKNVAWPAGKSLTFMPKPIFEDNGSGMHTHQSLWKGGEPLFFDETGYAGLSDIARWYIGGLLHHAHAVIAFTNPTTNSFKRLVPGYEAPVNLVYSQRNRSASCRIPLASQSPKAKRVEFRCPDSIVEPVPRLLGDDDGRPRRHPEPHRAADAGRQGPLRPPAGGAGARCRRCRRRSTRRSHALEADHDFLKAGGVFTDDLIETWIDYKRDERDRRHPPAPAPVRVRPLLRHLIRRI